MAINPETAFPGKIKASSSAYPYGEARDVTSPGDGTGTPWRAIGLNDVYGWQQAMLQAAGIVPSGSPDTAETSQYLEAMDALGGRRVPTTEGILTKDLTDVPIVRSDSYANIFDRGGAAWVSTGVNMPGSAGTFDRANGKIYDSEGNEFGYINGTTVTLDHFGLVAGNTGDGKAILDDVMAYADCILMDGTYTVSNVEFPNKTLTFRATGVQWSIFKSADGLGDPDYFAAPLEWINSTSGASARVSTYNVGFDGGTKDIALVIHWFFGDHENLFIDGSGTFGGKMTAKNKDGSTIASTMVNNRIRNIWLQGTADTGFFVDEDGKTTDWHLEGGFIFNTGSINLEARTLAGADISGIHTYNSPIGGQFKKWSTGTRIRGNYFEGDVVVREGLNDVTAMQFGPDNHVLGELTLLFGVVAGPVKSFGNFLKNVSHDFFGDKRFYTNGDSYTDASPFGFDNPAVGNAAKIRVTHALVGGESYSGALEPAFGTTDINDLIDDFKPQAPFLDKNGIVGANTISQDIIVPSLASDSSYTVIWDIGARVNHTGAVEIAAAYRWNLTRKQLTATYGVTIMSDNLENGTFTAGPTLSAVDNGNGTVTITVDATWTDAGFGVGSSNIMVL